MIYFLLILWEESVWLLFFFFFFFGIRNEIILVMNNGVTTHEHYNLCWDLDVLLKFISLSLILGMIMPSLAATAKAYIYNIEELKRMAWRL